MEQTIFDRLAKKIITLVCVKHKNTTSNCMIFIINSQSTAHFLTYFFDWSTSRFTSFVKPLANYDKSLKIVHHKLAQETVFCTPSYIGPINDRILHLTIKLADSSHGIRRPNLLYTHQDLSTYCPI